MSEESEAEPIGDGQEQQVHDQLARYWSWVEETSGLELAAVRKVGVDGSTESFSVSQFDNQALDSGRLNRHGLNRNGLNRNGLNLDDVDGNEPGHNQPGEGEPGYQEVGRTGLGQAELGQAGFERVEPGDDELFEMGGLAEAPVGRSGLDSLSATDDLGVELLDLLNVEDPSRGLGQPSSGSRVRSDVDIDVVVRSKGGRVTGTLVRVLIAMCAMGVAVFAAVKVQPWVTNSPSELAVDTSASPLPEDPEGALFLLPSEVSGLVPQNASVWDTSNTGAPEHQRVLVLGIRDGSVYRDLINVRILDADADADATGGPNDGTNEARAGLRSWAASVRDEGEVIELSTGPAYIFDENVGLALVQWQGSDIVLVQASEDRGLDRLIELMEGISIGVGEVIHIESSLGLTVLADVRSVSVEPSQGLFFSVELEQTGAAGSPVKQIEVETWSAPTPIAGVAMIGGEVSSMQVAGHDAWFLEVFDSDLGTGGDQDKPYKGVAWQATANRIVAVSGNVSLEELLAVAESLQVVDEAAWLEVFPGAG